MSGYVGEETPCCSCRWALVITADEAWAAILALAWIENACAERKPVCMFLLGKARDAPVGESIEEAVVDGLVKDSSAGSSQSLLLRPEPHRDWTYRGRVPENESADEVNCMEFESYWE